MNSRTDNATVLAAREAYNKVWSELAARLEMLSEDQRLGLAHEHAGQPMQERLVPFEGMNEVQRATLFGVIMAIMCKRGMDWWQFQPER